MNVLSVHKDKDLQQKMKSFFKDTEIDVDDVSSPEDALKDLKDGGFDAVVSGFDLPDMDGLTFLKTIREDKEFDIPFIFYTEETKSDIIREALNLGADKYLVIEKTTFETLVDTMQEKVDKYKEKKSTSKKENENIVGDKILENSPLPTFVMDSEGYVKRVNKAFLNSYDLQSKDRILGTNALNRPANIKHGVVKYMKEALKGKSVETPEVDFTTPDGVRTVTKSRLFPIFDEKKNVTHVVVMHDDITERKLAEEERFKARKEAAVLKERAEIIEAIPEIIFILNEKLELIDWNKTAEDRLGYQSEEIKGRPILDFISEDDKDLINEVIEGAIENVYTSKEGKLITKDGGKIPHSWSASSISGEDDLKIVAIGRDITERKKAEERERFLNSLLRHDVKNKAQIVQGYLKLAKDYDIPEDLDVFLDKSSDAARESIDLIEKVKALYDVEKEKMKPVMIYSIIDEVVEENRSNADVKNIDIDVKISDPDIKIWGGLLLKELFTNLIGNSIKHSDCDKIRIRSEQKEDECIIAVEDDGQGIPDRFKDKIFEKGFKKGKSAGSGLGMYMAKEILDNYDGKIEIKDSDLGGARFDVHLKRIDSS